jgi:hypothetical protein
MINEIMHNLGLQKNFLGCFMRENIPIIKKNKGCIINLDDMDNQGTHWTALYNDNGQYLYFDSYGMPPPEELKNLKIIFSDTHLQEITSSSCGAWCIWFLYKCMKGENYYDMLMGMNNYNPSYHEKKLQEFFNKIY